LKELNFSWQKIRVALKAWLHVKYNNFEIILKLFQRLISHVATDSVKQTL